MASYVNEALKVCDQIADNLPGFIKGILEKIEVASKVPKNKIVAGLLGAVALYMIFGYFAQFICNFVGFALPAYWSIGAIETSDKKDDTRWLTYWVVFASFSCLDFFADGIFSYFPLYWLGKIVFLAWCFAPTEQNGSQIIYNKLVRPYFLRKKNTIDSVLQQGKEVVNDYMKKD